MILDPEVGVPLLDGLLSQLVNAYVRPMAAMLFPEDVGRHEDTTGKTMPLVRCHFVVKNDDFTKSGSGQT